MALAKHPRRMSQRGYKSSRYDHRDSVKLSSNKRGRREDGMTVVQQLEDMEIEAYLDLDVEYEDE